MSSKLPSKPPAPLKEISDIYVEDVYPPKRTFSVGEEVEYGNNEKAVILSSHHDGKLYFVEVTQQNRDGYRTFQSHIMWHQLHKLGRRATEEAKPVLCQEDNLRYHSLNSQVSSLLTRVFTMGVEFNPAYQRGLEWTPEQKENLIATLISRGSIGIFAFNRRNYGLPQKLYEVVDGKQRLHTLVEYVQDQFPFQGKFYSDLSPLDRHLIKEGPVSIYDLEDASEKEVLTLFLRINREGTPVNIEHIRQVENRLKEIVS